VPLEQPQTPKKPWKKKKKKTTTTKTKREILREMVDPPTTRTSKEAHRKEKKKVRMRKMREKKNFEGNGWILPTAWTSEETNKEERTMTVGSSGNWAAGIVSSPTNPGVLRAE